MQRDGDRQKLFTRRTALLAGGKLVLLSTLVGRMYYLQVLESERYATLADENRINIRLLSPPRGRIVDRFGVPVAVNQQNHRVVLVPKDAEPIKATLDALGAITCWGRDNYGQVSDAPTGTGYTDVAVGQTFVCAIDEDGAVECWGDNTYGQVSDTPTTSSYAP